VGGCVVISDKVQRTGMWALSWGQYWRRDRSTMGGIAKGLGTPSISNSSGLPGCSPGWNCQDPELRDDERFQAGTATKTVDFWPCCEGSRASF
jgi:hypothetical protein